MNIFENVRQSLINMFFKSVFVCALISVIMSARLFPSYINISILFSICAYIYIHLYIYLIYISQ